MHPANNVSKKCRSHALGFYNIFSTSFTPQKAFYHFAKNGVVALAG